MNKVEYKYLGYLLLIKVINKLVIMKLIFSFQIFFFTKI